MNEAEIRSDIIDHVEITLNRQRQKWPVEHDRAHERFEWLGLIAESAARGHYVVAAALCISAEIAFQMNHPEPAHAE